MILDEIRRLRDADPFQPYRLVLADGEQLLIDRRSGIGIGPEGRYLVYPLPAGGYKLVDPAHVKAAVAATETAA